MKKTRKGFVKSVSEINKVSVLHFNQEGMENTVVSWEMLPFQVFGVDSNRLYVVAPILYKGEKCTFSFIDTLFPLVFL